ncbi:MAG: peptidoglycan DD-metalloendopeptidase family protein [Fibrobacteria bacterium]|nr:peptidoglycan DD-metalloendopeptidase family protein [Fibrobacteria bacterium]
MVRLTRYVFLMLVFGLCATHSGFSKNLSTELQKQKRVLKNIKHALEKERKELNTVLKRKTDVLGKIRKINENTGLIEEYIRQLNKTSRTLKYSQEKQETELDSLIKRINHRHRLIGKRVRMLFIKGNPVTRKNIFLGMELQDNTDFLKTVYLLKRMVEYDKKMIHESRQDEIEKREKIYELKKKMKEVIAFKKFKIREITNFTNEQDELKNQIVKLQNDEQAKRQALNEMERNAEALAAIIKTLERQRRSELAKNARKINKKGEFCRPSKGRIVSMFGLHYHSKLKTSTRNLGVEYLGDAGSAVLSAAEGEVVYEGNIPGYGKGLIIYNGSGYYNIYGNLHNIKVKSGDKVKGCREIARVPRDISSSRRNVYFEVRKEKDPVDPVKWLKSMIN